MIGLILFITTIFVGLAAVATQTKEIRFTLPEGQRPWLGVPESFEGERGGEMPTEEFADRADVDVQFFRVPIAWPLMVSGGLGLLLWFGTAPHVPVKSPRRSRRRRRK